MLSVRPYQSVDKEAWDSYVLEHSNSTHCHLSGWKEVIEQAYGHKTYYLIAEQSPAPANPTNPSNPMNPSNSTNPSNSSNPSNRVVGILPLVHIKSLIFGNQLISMPFLNYGGVLADDEETEMRLLSEATNLGHKLKVDKIELRHIHPLACVNHPTSETYTHKVRMLLELSGTGDELFKSFKTNLRNKIRRSPKEGMKATIGGQELLDSFYDVFSVNMRDLGSPVHSKEFFRQIFQRFDQSARIGIVDYQGIPVAAGLICCFNDAIEIPWGSSLRAYNRFHTNNFLYWSLLEYSCENGFKYFDFGRSTPEEGTYKFKEQWGARPMTLHWQTIFMDANRNHAYGSEKSRFGKFIYIWQRIPVSLTKMVGPVIRKRIGL